MNELPSAPPDLERDAHKGDAGRVLVLAGSSEMPGAALLTVRAAQRAGAGLVTLACFDADLMRVLPAASPETIYMDLSSSRELYAEQLPAAVRAHAHQVRVAGPGLGQRPRTRELVECLMEDREFEGVTVLDADALNVVEGRLELLAGCKGTLVLTPHPGEARRLLGRDVPAHTEGRIEAAAELARRASALCVLKGAGSVVSDGERHLVNPTGGPGMATAGAGDVLAGIAGAYLTQVGRPLADGSTFGALEALCAAVYVHGLAGELGQEQRGVRGLIASDLVELLPAAQLRHRSGG